MGDLVYVGSYTPDADGTGVGITVWRRAGARLSPVGELATPAPSYLVADPRLPVLYACNELTAGTVSSYQIEPGGVPRPLSRQSTGGETPCYLALHQGYLLAANYGSGSVSAHRIGPDGRLGPATDTVRLTGRGPDPERQEGPHAHQVRVDAAGRLTVVDLGTDRLLHQRFDPATGRFSPAGYTQAPPGTGPRHAVAHPAGYWYVTAELSSTVLVYAPDPTTGALRQLAEHPATLSTPDGVNQPSGIALSHDGRFVYVANRGADTVVTFAVEADGTLLPVGEVSSGGDWPRQFAIVEDLMFVANQRSGSVVALRLDPDLGIPRETGQVTEVPSPSCVLPH